MPKKRTIAKVTGTAVVSVAIAGGTYALQAGASSGQPSDPDQNQQKTTSHASISTSVNNGSSGNAPVNSSVNVSSSSSSDDPTSNTQVTVNGEPVDVPENGTVTKTVHSGDTTTTTSVSHSTTGQASNFSSSNSSVHVSTNVTQHVQEETDH